MSDEATFKDYIFPGISALFTVFQGLLMWINIVITKKNNKATAEDIDRQITALNNITAEIRNGKNLSPKQDELLRITEQKNQITLFINQLNSIHTSYHAGQPIDNKTYNSLKEFFDFIEMNPDIFPNDVISDIDRYIGHLEALSKIKPFDPNQDHQKNSSMYRCLFDYVIKLRNKTLPAVKRNLTKEIHQLSTNK